MSGQPLEIAGPYSKTTKGNIDKWYDNDGNGWASKAAATDPETGVPFVLRERKTILIEANPEDGLSRPTEFWWNEDTSDEALQEKTAGALSQEPFRLYEQDVDYKSGDRIYHSDPRTLAYILEDFTASFPKLAQEYNENVYMNIIYREQSLYFGFSGEEESFYSEVFYTNAILVFEITPTGTGELFIVADTDTSLTDMRGRMRFNIPAGTTLKVIFSPDHFRGDLPVLSERFYPTATVLEYEFLYKFDWRDGVRKYEWQKPAGSYPATTTATVSYGWIDTDPYPELSEGIDNLIFNGTINVPTDATHIITDMQDGNMQFLFWRVPTGFPIFTAWNDGSLVDGVFSAGGVNYGTIPDSVMREIISFGGFDYYLTNQETALSVGSDRRVRLSA